MPNDHSDEPLIKSPTQLFYVISESLHALDVLANGRLCVYEQHSGDNQQFQFEAVEDEVFLIKCVCRPGCVVNVDRADLEDGTAVTCHPQRGTPSQRFKLQRVSDSPFFHIVAQHSGKALTIDHEQDPTTKYVVQRTIDPDNPSQRFLLVPRGPVQWYWAGGDRPGNNTGFNCNWQEYGSDSARRLEEAFAGHQRKVDLDAARVADLTDSSRMIQVRKDDPGAWRRIVRVVRLAPVKWYVWSKEKGWTAYDEPEAARLEIAYNAPLKRVEVRSAYVDMVTKTAMQEFVPYDPGANDRVVVRRLCLGTGYEPKDPPVAPVVRPAANGSGGGMSRSMTVSTSVDLSVRPTLKVSGVDADSPEARQLKRWLDENKLGQHFERLLHLGCTSLDWLEEVLKLTKEELVAEGIPRLHAQKLLEKAAEYVEWDQFFLERRVDRVDIDLSEPIGEGHYGKVFRGQHPVFGVLALKEVRRGQFDFADFKAEADILSSLKHDNIVPLIGLTHIECKYYICFAYLPLGSMDKYLQRMKLSDITVPMKTIIDCFYGAASGLRYLESVKIVHRDIACRNLLVWRTASGAFSVKIADFGLARKVELDSYRVSSKKRALPVYYLAPESLPDPRTSEQRNFSSKSDVWSFGIALWEALEYAQIHPYPTHDGKEDVIQAISSGELNPKPQRCVLDEDGVGESLWLLMLDCWRQNPAERPSFESVQQRLRQLDAEVAVTQPDLPRLPMTGSYVD